MSFVDKFTDLLFDGTILFVDEEYGEPRTNNGSLNLAAPPYRIGDEYVLEFPYFIRRDPILNKLYKIDFAWGIKVCTSIPLSNCDCAFLKSITLSVDELKKAVKLGKAAQTIDLPLQYIMKVSSDKMCHPDISISITCTPDPRQKSAYLIEKLIIRLPVRLGDHWFERMCLYRRQMISDK